MNYILKGETPIPTTDILAWAAWFEDADRQLERTQVSVSNQVAFDDDEAAWVFEKEMIEVSTVFMGLDHNFSNEGPPILFETMVFGGALDQEQARYATWEEAEAGHKVMVEMVKKELAEAK